MAIEGDGSEFALMVLYPCSGPTRHAEDLYDQLSSVVVVMRVDRIVECLSGGVRPVPFA